MTLTRGVVGLWSTRPSERAAVVLTATESARRARYRQPADRDRSGAGAALVRLAVREATGDAAADVARRCPGCDATDHGPTSVVGGGERGSWSVSLSHSGDLVTVAVARGVGAVGVDVEESCADVPAVASVLCRDDERGDDLAAPDPRAALLARWVRKEAVLKAARVGLTVPMRHLAVSAAHEPARLRHWEPRTRPAGLDVGLVACADLPGDVLAQAGGDHRGAVAALATGPGPLRLAHRWVDARELEQVRPSATPAGT
ncbi:4'-phosphopantetheinyl transferase family protein [Cellulomonas cellasea]|uniref:4'-phosphopantetheinyl transferase domain-containing protein n=2 Tax=Cellulomonas cellasea TaxID=43670 RepID=A0A0A0B3E3_9CELL|nr:4'-phosphopantetheinyl transferase superfamily protein [Cellulomonas cellasea]KGM00707.1 hypothetical protein Q760_06490 [Cellulomonas cellasea DSM 20118]GEA86615.1 4'-phosphopantetheinyl transferase [Cellulomonas cellasea]